MDNVTHTLVGLLMAEAALRLRESRAGPTSSLATFRAPATLVSILANNAPDADSFYASLLTNPLGSLLHHRGHTHTLVLVPLLAALCLAVTLGIDRARGNRWQRNDFAWLAALAMAGVAMHIGLDATNSYGVHPFWPFYDGWFYGDSIFIVEPLLWAALIPPLVFAVGPRWAKISLVTVLLFGIGICWMREFVPRSMAAVVTLIAVLSALASRKATPNARVVLSAGAAAAVALTFAVAGSSARNEVNRATETAFPRAVTHDTVLTPMPANPFCWQVVLVQTEGERYFARTGMVAIFPSLLTSSECPFNVWAKPTAPSEPLLGRATPNLRWIHQFSAPTHELRALAKESCVFAALLRFSRSPFWSRDEHLGRVAGDIRYDRSSGLDFSDTVLDNVACPQNLPPWIPPRHELLGVR